MEFPSQRSGLGGLAYGGDYNPEQWPEPVWQEDARLMRQAGVSLVTVGVFAWARIEPSPGLRDLGWLDRVLDLLHDHGISVDLATATASPPPWLTHRHPEVLPVDRFGNRLAHGSRQSWCPSSPVYREYALSLVEDLAKRYGHHPALALWHVSNELGCHNALCYCEVSAAAFRRWLRHRYGDLDRLNDAWGTMFWSQRYGDWEEIVPPRASTAHLNPTAQLDFTRFSSDELLAQYLAEREVLRRLSPDLPVTTNLMVSSRPGHMNYWQWAPHMDVVSNDHYLDGTLADPHVELSMSADWSRGLAGGSPWLLMEHSTSAVNWQARNYAKAPGQLIRNSLQHVARGAEFVGFFQWRASRSGAEKFHSAMLPHAGTDSKVWREVVELGRILHATGDVAGTRVAAEAAILLDYPSWWGIELDCHPTVDVSYMDRVLALYKALWDAGVTTDVRHPEQDLSRYRIVLAPGLYAVADAAAANLESFVEGGGHLVVTYFSGVVDAYDHVRDGGFDAALRNTLGIRVEEVFPLAPGQGVALDDGGQADIWSELLRLDGAEAVVSYASGPLAGVPAITRHPRGTGVGWYVGTRTDPAATGRLVRRILDEAGVRGGEAPAGVEVVRRLDDERSFLFVLNHTADAAAVPADGVDIVSGSTCAGTVTVPGGGVAVVRERARPAATQRPAR